jgi:hypothetical protein
MNTTKKRDCTCRACGLVFGGDRGFDPHRYGAYVDEHPHYGRSCRTEQELPDLGLVRNDRGVWVQRYRDTLDRGI